MSNHCEVVVCVYCGARECTTCDRGPQLQVDIKNPPPELICTPKIEGFTSWGSRIYIVVLNVITVVAGWNNGYF